MSPLWILLEPRMMEVVMTDWSYKTCKAPVKMSPSTNQHPTFYRLDALPVAQPTVSEHWRENQRTKRRNTTDYHEHNQSSPRVSIQTTRSNKLRISEDTQNLTFHGPTHLRTTPLQPRFTLFYWQKIQDFPGPPWKFFQDLFGARECLNIKKKRHLLTIFRV